MLAIILPVRIKADVSYHASLQDQGRCYLSCFPSGSRPMFAIKIPFRIKADVSYHASLSMIDDIGLDPEGKHDS
jgi:hypothetical protein